MTLSEERLRHMLAHIGPPSADLAVSYRTDELHSILTELLSRRASYLDARMRKGADEFAAILTADMTRALPGDIMDDSTYEQIEGALDAADAPIRDVNGRFFTLAERIRSALSLRSDAHTSGEVTEYDPDAPPDHSADNAADFIFKHLSDALGVDGKWSVSDGTETWDGDVAGTLYNILIAAGIWDNENGQLAGPIAWLVGWDENPYGMFARTETEANHVIANLNAYAKGVRTNLRAKPLFASPALSLGHPIQGEASDLEQIVRDLRLFIYTNSKHLPEAKRAAIHDYMKRKGIAGSVFRAAPAEDATLCGDCPPLDYPTDDTRCTPCPRRASQPPTPAGVREITDALQYAAKGLDMIHNGLMDPTRPRQAVGEVCAHFLKAVNAALAAAKEAGE